jgi:hypothetical protein
MRNSNNKVFEVENHEKFVTLLIEAYSDAVTLFNSFGSPILENNISMVNLLCTTTQAASIRTQDVLYTGSYPLSKAVFFEHYDVTKRIYEAYPEAIKTFSYEGSSALHVLIRNIAKLLHDGSYGKKVIYEKADTKTCQLRLLDFLLLHYPSGVNAVKVFDEGDENDVAVEKPLRKTRSPYEYACDLNLPNYIIRRLLLACPNADQMKLRLLNYQARRMAMILAFSKADATDFFVASLKKLVTYGDDMPLLKHIITFL